ncbi:MAG TPA: hypothetical protein VG965_03630 [Patescibacteria group bacterium]|nr:hypothetical protein [Patescibacteria group bacterium]
MQKSSSLYVIKLNTRHEVEAAQQLGVALVETDQTSRFRVAEEFGNRDGEEILTVKTMIELAAIELEKEEKKLRPRPPEWVNA